MLEQKRRAIQHISTALRRGRCGSWRNFRRSECERRDTAKKPRVKAGHVSTRSKLAGRVEPTAYLQPNIDPQHGGAHNFRRCC